MLSVISTQVNLLSRFWTDKMYISTGFMSTLMYKILLGSSGTVSEESSIHAGFADWQ